jgi:hypothetical protein
MTAWIWFMSNLTSFSGYSGDCFQLYKVYSSISTFNFKFCIAADESFSIKADFLNNGVSETKTISNIPTEISTWSYLYFTISNTNSRSVVFLETGKSLRK